MNAGASLGAIYHKERILFLRRWIDQDEVAAIFHFGEYSTSVTLSLPEGHRQKLFDSAEKCCNGPGSKIPSILVSEGESKISLSPLAFAVFVNKKEL